VPVISVFERRFYFATREVYDLDFNNAFLTIKEVQQCLRVSEPTALKIIHAEGFPKLTGIGKRLLIPKQAFQQWCIDNTTYEALGNLQELFIGGYSK
jgi:excisionase family DNA binding protein